jgi:hypothetical protein
MAALAAYGDVTAQVPDRKEEIMAFIVTALEEQQRALFIDEARSLMTDHLLTMITDEAGGRVKGHSRFQKGDLQLFLAAVNPSFSEMMARRTLVINLETYPDYKTKTFTKMITKSSLPQFRPAMLAFCRALVENWVAQGSPMGVLHPQWPEFSQVVGGILQAAGYEDPFSGASGLTHMDANDNDSADAQWPAFMEILASKEISFGQDWPTLENIPVNVVLQTAISADLFTHFSDKHPKIATRSFLKSLAKWRDTSISCHGYRLKSGRNSSGIHLSFKKVDEPK